MTHPTHHHPLPSWRYEWISPDSLHTGITIFAKSLLFFAAATLLLFAALFWLTQSIILNQFQSLENETLQLEAHRFQALLQAELDSLATTASDWANWRELETFARTGSPATFPADYLSPDDLSLLHLHFLLVWAPDSSLRILANSLNSSLQPDSLPPLSSFLPSPTSPASGFLHLKNQTFLASTFPLPHQAGAITLARKFPPPALQKLLPSTESYFSLLPASTPSPPLPPIQFPTPETALLHIPLPSPANTPIATLQLHLPRQIYQAGYRATRIFLLTMTAAGGGLVLVLWLVIFWSVLRPIAILDRNMRAFRISGLIPSAFGLHSTDELGRLARSFYDLTNWLREAEADFRRLFESSHDAMLLLEFPSLRIRQANPAAERLLQSPLSQITSSNLPALLPSLPSEQLLSALQNPPTPSSTPFWTSECTIPLPSGKTLFVEAEAVRFSTPHGDRAQITLRDISDRVHAARTLRELSGRLLRAQDEERRRISRELHDSTAQELSALSLNLSLLEIISDKDPSRAKQLATDSRQLADQISRSLRTLAYLLHPPLLDEQGLPFAARWLCEGFSTRTNISTSFDIPPDLPRASPEIETALFRFLQEALTNIYKHANAKNVAVRVWLAPSSPHNLLCAEVRDDGIGFDPASLPSRQGIGIAGMRERARINHGELTIHSAPNRGTTLTLALPFSPPSSPANP